MLREYKLKDIYQGSLKKGVDIIGGLTQLIKKAGPETPIHPYGLQFTCYLTAPRLCLFFNGSTISDIKIVAYVGIAGLIHDGFEEAHINQNVAL